MRTTNMGSKVCWASVKAENIAIQMRPRRYRQGKQDFIENDNTERKSLTRQGELLVGTQHALDFKFAENNATD